MNTDIALRLRVIMNHYGLKQGEFAKAIGVAKGNMSQMLKGDRPCGEAVVNKIKLAFENVSKAWLLTGEGEMFVTPPQSGGTIRQTKSVLMYIMERERVMASDLGRMFGHATAADMSQMLSGQRQMTMDEVKKLHDKFPRYDFWWLMTGEGDAMIKETAPPDIVAIATGSSATSVNGNATVNGKDSVRMEVMETKLQGLQRENELLRQQVNTLQELLLKR